MDWALVWDQMSDWRFYVPFSVVLLIFGFWLVRLVKLKAGDAIWTRRERVFAGMGCGVMGVFVGTSVGFALGAAYVVSLTAQ